MAYRVVTEDGALHCNSVQQVYKFVASLPNGSYHIAIIDEAYGVEFTPKDFLAEVNHVEGWELQQKFQQKWFGSDEGYLEQQSKLNHD